MSYLKKWLFIIVLFIVVLVFVSTLNTVFEHFTNEIKNANANGNEKSNKNIVLIGDSILNNSVYVFENQSVPELIQQHIQKDKTNMKCYNFAKDGSIISDCYNQLLHLDSGSGLNTKETTIFVSAGGNNILNSFIKTESFINNLFAEYLQLIDEIMNIYPSVTIVALNLFTHTLLLFTL